MSSNKASSSDFLAPKTSGSTTKGTASLGCGDASVSTSKSQKGSSPMLEAWENAPTSSEPWSAVKATYSPQR
ncbi:hypothetical protein PITC_001190 [Penicillium italicum]|uniref:Uncharacterized protein n=1 Tax=Penicillium italicum TaxID=40296 RepID=A0A0A2L7Z9_PENIT|nr:hypothetical protein PITC_001190 [Penicillium italicum]